MVPVALWRSHSLKYGTESHYIVWKDFSRRILFTKTTSGDYTCRKVSNYAGALQRFRLEYSYLENEFRQEKDGAVCDMCISKHITVISVHFVLMLNTHRMTA